MSSIKRLLNAFKRKYPALYQFISFGLVGTSALLVLLGAYDVVIWIGLNTQIANFVGFFLSTAYQYLMNFVFFFKGKEAPHRGAALKFFALYIALYFLSAFLIYLFVGVLHVSKWIAPIFNSLLITPPSFLGSKYWVFRKPKGGR
ncbi:MAG: GtrA family protein [Clostridia bacterium]|nr:GtrA family protein [Clostridia bacterium]